MSHKLWYAVFNPLILKFEVQGIPVDEGGLDNNKDELFYGSFRTKRTAQFVVDNGGMVGSIKETELAAKSPPLFTQQETKQMMDRVAEMPVELYSSTHLSKLVEGMMG